MMIGNYEVEKVVDNGNGFKIASVYSDDEIMQRFLSDTKFEYDPASKENERVVTV